VWKQLPIYCLILDFIKKLATALTYEKHCRSAAIAIVQCKNKTADGGCLNRNINEEKYLP